MVHVVDSGTDCLGDGGYEVGKNYLVYAKELDAADVILEGGFFWYGWTDVLPKGTKMLMPETGCTLGGETSSVRKAIRELGKARMPAKTDGSHIIPPPVAAEPCSWDGGSRLGS